MKDDEAEHMKPDDIRESLLPISNNLDIKESSIEKSVD
jgi:hypothetical protein